MARQPTRFIRKTEVCARTGYSHVHLWRLERAGKFPRRVQLGPNSVAWVEAEIEAWQQERVDARRKVCAGREPGPAADGGDS